MSNRIQILPQAVVDKIAAGEVVVRPVNAVKELIENCLDAGAKDITVSIQKGGLDLIKVQDNGCGILFEDMPIACSRFATSKLKEYKDLEQIGTFGFRGEALASISYVSAVTIISKTRQDKCAHKANFKDGIMCSELSNSAGLFGTTIIAEKLFYNCPSRRQSMKYPHEEANRIADLIVKYAIHYPNVSFAFRRLDNSSSDFRTLGNGNRHQTIQTLLHSKNAKIFSFPDLMDFKFNDENLQFFFEICLSVPISTYTSTAIQSKQNRQKIFHIFINDRLVDCPKLKQSLDALFETKDVMCQFITLSIKMDASRMDVNVHPTKAIVKFLDEDRIVERIEQKMFEWLKISQDKGAIEIPKNISSNITKINQNSSQNNSSFNKIDYEHIVIDDSILNNKEILKSPDGSQKSRKIVAELEKQQKLTNFNLNKEMDSSPSRRLNQSFIKNMAMRSSSTISTGESNLHKISKVSQASSILQTNENSIGIFSGSNSTQRVRIDPSTRKLDEFLMTSSSTGSTHNPHYQQRLSTDIRLVSLNLLTNSINDKSNELQSVNEINEKNAFELQTTINPSANNIPSVERLFELESLVYLRQEICAAASIEIGNLFKRHQFVGFVGTDFAVMQCDSGAYIFQISALLREFFYQLVIFSFGNMGSYSLDSKIATTTDSVNEMINVHEFLSIYLFNDEMDLNLRKPDEIKKVKDLANILLQNSQLLWDYFSIEIIIGKDNNGLYLRSIPCILDGYAPLLEQLPQLLFDLASNVVYDEEMSCFRDVALALADFFTPILGGPFEEDSEKNIQIDSFNETIVKERNDDESAKQRQETIRQLQSLIFPALKCKFLPPKRLANFANNKKSPTVIQQITSIEQAFKKFGRC